MAIRSPAVVAKKLVKIYDVEFGGKDRGRYQISRQGLCQLAGRRRLDGRSIEEIVGEAYELGLVVTDMGDDFSIIGEEVMRSYRKVPERIIDELSRT